MNCRVKYLFLLALFLCPLMDLSGPGCALAQSDNIVGEEEVDIEDDEEMEVEDEEDEEEPVTVPDTSSDVSEEDGDVLDDDEDEDEEERKIGPHPDAATTLIFTDHQSKEFSAGDIVHALIGFTNDAESEFIVTGIEASFRYPQDFGYFIQNFSMVPYETYVMPQTQVSFEYSFIPSESFYARPFGLTVNIYYRDVDGDMYIDAVFNETVNIVEVEEGFDGETFFMYAFMVSGISILMFIIHYVYTTTVRKSGRSSKKGMETGTQNKDDIDYQWLPKGSIPGTPRKSPRASPRKTKK